MPQLILCITIYFIFMNSTNWSLLCPVSEPELFLWLADMCDCALNWYTSKHVEIKLLGISYEKLDNAATNNSCTLKWIHCVTLYFFTLTVFLILIIYLSICFPKHLALIFTWCGKAVNANHKLPRGRCLCACHEGIWRSGGTAPLILNLG